MEELYYSDYYYRNVSRRIFLLYENKCFHYNRKRIVINTSRMLVVGKRRVLVVLVTYQASCRKRFNYCKKVARTQHVGYFLCALFALHLHICVYFIGGCNAINFYASARLTQKTRWSFRNWFFWQFNRVFTNKRLARKFSMPRSNYINNRNSVV